MILPTKHTNLPKSLLGFGSYILQVLETPTNIDELWKRYQEDYIQRKYAEVQSFDTLHLALIFLFSIGAITEKNGVINRCD